MKNRTEKASDASGVSAVWNGFTFVYTALGVAIGLGLVLHIWNTGLEQIPNWVLIVTALLLGISAVVSQKSGNYTGIIAGVISLFGVVLMMWLTPYLPLDPGNSSLDQMMVRMVSALPYFPILAGIVGVISSLSNIKKTV